MKTLEKSSFVPIAIGRNLVADGTRVTQEFASFLKEINRFQSK